MENNLFKFFEEIHNHIYANDGLSPEKSLEEMIKILVIKIYDESSKNKIFYINKDEYCNIENLGSDKDFESRLLKNNQILGDKFSFVFTNNVSINLKLSTISFIVLKLQKINFSKLNSDVKAIAFQKFLSSSERSGRGQFFTPKPVIEMIVKIIRPNSKDKIIDPASGTGSFLDYSANYISKNEPKTKSTKIFENIYGVDISKLATQITIVRMMLLSKDIPKIIQSDALSSFDKLEKDFSISLKSKTPSLRGYFDIVITNPPFGSQGKINDKLILKKFNLGHKWNKLNTNFCLSKKILDRQVPDILYIERCIELLKPGGRMAIVLPNGIFENSSLEYVREFIFQKANIFSVIKLPQETFVPSGTGIKTSILFLQKKSNDNKKNMTKKIFFREVNKLGYKANKNAETIFKKDDLGNILFDDTDKQIIDEDISDTINEFNSYESNELPLMSDSSYILNYTDINVKRFDFEFHKPVHLKNIHYLKSKNSIKLSELLDIKKERPNLLKEKDRKVRYVELSDVNNIYGEINNSSEMLVHELPSRASFLINKGNIITAVSGNSVGTSKHISAYVTKNYSDCICTNGFAVLDLTNSKVNPFYLLYFLRSNYFLDQAARYKTGAAIPSISIKDLSEILIYLPSKEEQTYVGNKIKKGFLDRQNYISELSKIKFL
ncbi:N-6 DNA methylase [Chloroflexi bacterium]|nr:N-6 DNA methylase [Chloroflexota bacterium]